MATVSVAPEPPSQWKKPQGYMALRCQFCLCWSTMPSPFTHGKAAQCKFYPLMPWYQGTRDNPKGCICLLCVNVSRLKFSNQSLTRVSHVAVSYLLIILSRIQYSSFSVLDLDLDFTTGFPILDLVRCTTVAAGR